MIETESAAPKSWAGRRLTMMSFVERAASFHAGLASAGRSDEIPESHDVYGWLVGSWELDVKHYWAVNVSSEGIKGEMHAGWVLEGRAVQDIWIMPRRAERGPNPDKKRNMYGSTLRAWDSSIQAWRIIWSNPAGDHFEQQIGKRSGNDIIQLGQRADGSSTRWSFVEITDDSFHWLGESQPVNGNEWILEGEFLARRMR
jgi:hypothetical protein